MVEIEKLKNIIGKNKPFSIGILIGILFISILIPVILTNDQTESNKFYYYHFFLLIIGFPDMVEQTNI